MPNGMRANRDKPDETERRQSPLCSRTDGPFGERTNQALKEMRTTGAGALRPGGGGPASGMLGEANVVLAKRDSGKLYRSELTLGEDALIRGLQVEEDELEDVVRKTKTHQLVALHLRNVVLDVLKGRGLRFQTAGHACGHAVRQRAEGHVRIPAVPPRDAHPFRLGPCIRAVARKAAATARMTRAEIKACLAPGFLGNVLLAGELRCMT